MLVLGPGNPVTPLNTNWLSPSVFSVAGLSAGSGEGGWREMSFEARNPGWE